MYMYSMDVVLMSIQTFQTGSQYKERMGEKNGFIMQTLRVIRCNSFFLREINKRTFIYIGKF